MTASLRKAALSDLEFIVKTHTQAWTFAYSGFMDSEFIKQKNATRLARWSYSLPESADKDKYYIASVDGVDVGFVSLYPPRESPYDGLYELYGIYLLPEYTHYGRGRYIVKECEQIAISKGYTSLSVWVLAPNVNAFHFFEKLGFEEDGNMKMSYYDKPVRLKRLVKKLV